jgi:hypothetical protein
MRRRALLSGLLIGGVAVLSGALTAAPALEIPLEPDDGGEEPPEGEDPLAPPSPEPPAPPPLPPGPEDDDEEERPATEPA